MNNKKGLGRGLGALLSVFDEEEEMVAEAPKSQEAPVAPVPQPAPQPVQESAPVEEQSEDLDEILDQISNMENPRDIADAPVFEAGALPTRSEYDDAVAKLVYPSTNPVGGLEDSEPIDKNMTNVREVPLDLLEVNPNQPRKYFDEVALAELAESIKIHGIIQPLVVNQLFTGRFMIIAGERRYRAAKLAGLKTVPCVLKEYTERQVKEISLIENLQREDLNPIEAARAIKQLMEEYNFTQEVVADRIGKSRPTVTNMLRLLTLTPEVITFVEQGFLSAGHARAIVAVTDRALQFKVAKTTIDKKLSVREVERLVREVLKPRKPNENRPRFAQQSPELVNFTEELQRVFSTRVSIQGTDTRGRISIDYFSKDDLDRIFDLIELLKNKKLTLQDLSNFNKRQ